MGAWNIFPWLRIWTSGGSCENGNETSGNRRGREFAESVSDFLLLQDSAVKLVSYRQQLFGLVLSMFLPPSSYFFPLLALSLLFLPTVSTHAFLSFTPSFPCSYSSSCRCQNRLHRSISPGPRLTLWLFRSMIRFYGEELLAPRPKPKKEEHTFSADCDCLFNILAATLHIGGRSFIHNPRTRHVVVIRTEGKRPLGRPRRRWQDNIKMDLQKVGCGGCGMNRAGWG